MVAVYSRCSTLVQKTDRQLIGLTDTSEEIRCYEDRGVSGAVNFRDRPAGSRLWKDVEAGLVHEIRFWETTRIGRGARDILTTLYDLVDLQIQVVVVKDGIRLLDDETKKINPMAQIILSVLSALSEQERNLIKERTREGIEACKRRGGYLGRQKGTTESAAKFLNKQKNLDIRRFLEANTPITHIAKLVPCSTATVYKVKSTLESLESAA
jgi:DNA invertase Pin-like site-specific DNA recombinase